MINDKYQIEYENETRFLESQAHVLRVTADAICQQNFDSVANCFFRKEAYYLEENAKIFVLTNSFNTPLSKFTQNDE